MTTTTAAALVAVVACGCAQAKAREERERAKDDMSRGDLSFRSLVLSLSFGSRYMKERHAGGKATEE